MKLAKLKIVVLGFGLILFSCQKENITPMQDTSVPVPVWNDSEKARTGGEDDSNDPNTGGDVPVDVITDPNSDPDGDKGSKTKKS
jgi:hypothetical protein